jgi:hypothetical protein
MVATGLGYPIVLWVFEFNQHGEPPTANLDRTGRATRSGRSSSATTAER